jgi:hypothetical protein
MELILKKHTMNTMRIQSLRQALPHFDVGLSVEDQAANIGALLLKNPQNLLELAALLRPAGDVIVPPDALKRFLSNSYIFAPPRTPTELHPDTNGLDHPSPSIGKLFFNSSFHCNCGSIMTQLPSPPDALYDDPTLLRFRMEILLSGLPSYFNQHGLIMGTPEAGSIFTPHIVNDLAQMLTDKIQGIRKFGPTFDTTYPVFNFSEDKHFTIVRNGRKIRLPARVSEGAQTTKNEFVELFSFERHQLNFWKLQIYLPNAPISGRPPSASDVIEARVEDLYAQGSSLFFDLLIQKDSFSPSGALDDKHVATRTEDHVHKTGHDFAGVQRITGRELSTYLNQNHLLLCPVITWSNTSLLGGIEGGIVAADAGNNNIQAAGAEVGLDAAIQLALLEATLAEQSLEELLNLFDRQTADREEFERQERQREQERLNSPLPPNTNKQELETIFFRERSEAFERNRLLQIQEDATAEEIRKAKEAAEAKQAALDAAKAEKAAAEAAAKAAAEQAAEEEAARIAAVAQAALDAAAEEAAKKVAEEKAEEVEKARVADANRVEMLRRLEEAAAKSSLAAAEKAEAERLEEAKRVAEEKAKAELEAERKRAEARDKAKQEAEQRARDEAESRARQQKIDRDNSEVRLLRKQDIENAPQERLNKETDRWVKILALIISILSFITGITLPLYFGFLTPPPSGTKDVADTIIRPQARFVLQSVSPSADTWEDGCFSSSIACGVNSAGPASVLLHAYISADADVESQGGVRLRIPVGAYINIQVSHLILPGDGRLAYNKVSVNLDELSFNSSPFQQRPPPGESQDSSSVKLSLQEGYSPTSIMESFRSHVEYKGDISQTDATLKYNGYVKFLSFTADKDYYFRGGKPVSLERILPPTSTLRTASRWKYAGHLILTMSGLSTNGEALNAPTAFPSFMLWTAQAGVRFNRDDVVTTQATDILDNTYGALNCLRPIDPVYSVNAEKQFTIDFRMSTDAVEALVAPGLTKLRFTLRTPPGASNEFRSVPASPPRGFHEWGRDSLSGFTGPKCQVLFGSPRLPLEGEISPDTWRDVPGAILDCQNVMSRADSPITPSQALYEQTLTFECFLDVVSLIKSSAIFKKDFMEVRVILPAARFSYAPPDPLPPSGSAAFLNETFHLKLTARGGSGFESRQVACSAFAPTRNFN